MAAENLLWTSLAVAGVLGVMIAAGLGTGSLLMALVLGALALLATWRYWLPVRFVLGPTGVTQTILGRHYVIPWKAVGRIEIRRHGVLLLPEDDAVPISKLRSLPIPWGGQQQNLLAAIDYYSRNNRAPDSTHRRR